MNYTNSLHIDKLVLQEVIIILNNLYNKYNACRIIFKSILICKVVIMIVFIKTVVFTTLKEVVYLIELSWVIVRLCAVVKNVQYHGEIY